MRKLIHGLFTVSLATGCTTTSLLDEEPVPEEEAEVLATDAALSAQQRTAWERLEELSAGAAEVSWDPRRAMPAHVRLGIELRGRDGASAYADLQARLGGVLAGMYRKQPGDVTKAATRDDRLEQDTIYTVTETRQFAGIDVIGDRVETTLTQTADDVWEASITSRWTAGVERVVMTPTLSAAQAVDRALAAPGVGNGHVTRGAQLGFYPTATGAELCWDIAVGNDHGEAWRLFVSAHTGEIVDRTDSVLHYDGTLKMHVGLPHSGSVKTVQSMPFATIYEDAAAYGSSSNLCSGTTPAQTRGNAFLDLGTTALYGNYSGLTGVDPADTSWVVDYRGTFVSDHSKPGVLSLPSFTAGGTHTFAQSETNHQSRRGEMYYLLNHGHSFYRNNAIGVFPNLGFLYYSYTDPSDDTCDNPEDEAYCCSGSTAGGNGCVILDCYDQGITAAPSVERRFRQTIFHELNHSLYDYATGGVFCPGAGGDECLPAEEGRADFGALIGTQFETIRSGFRSDASYPEDWGGQYVGGQIWAATYAHYLLRVGKYSAVYGVHKNLAFLDKATQMVGACSDSDSDGYVEVSECPANSYYRYLLAADDAYNGAFEHAYEISEVFHSHVTDASRIVAGVQTFPWADQLPNTNLTPPFVAVETGSPVTLTTGPVAGSGNLTLDKSDDYDAVLFLGRAGETYLLETLNLAAGVDTIIEVRSRTGTLLAENDFCGFSLRSCLNFTPSSTGFYILKVRAKSGSQTGPGKTYQLKLDNTTDDYGDTIAAAAPLATNTTWKAGSIAAGDIDMFRIVSSTPQMLSFLGCGGNPVTVEVLDLSSNVLATLTNSSCASAPATVAINAGTYFLRATASALQPYWVRATLATDLDIDSTPANAWPLVTGDAGRVIGADLSSATDVDWFEVTLWAGQSYTVETFGSTSVPTLEVYAPSTTVYGRQGTLDSLPDASGFGLGYYMMRDTGGALDGNGSRVAFMAPVTGTYWIRVSGTATTNYSLMFEDTLQNNGFSGNPFP